MIRLFAVAVLLAYFAAQQFPSNLCAANETLQIGPTSNDAPGMILDPLPSAEPPGVIWTIDVENENITKGYVLYVNNSAHTLLRIDTWLLTDTSIRLFEGQSVPERYKDLDRSSFILNFPYIFTLAAYNCSGPNVILPAPGAPKFRPDHN